MAFDMARERGGTRVSARHNGHLRATTWAAVLAENRDRGIVEGASGLGPGHPHVIAELF